MIEVTVRSVDRDPGQWPGPSQSAAVHACPGEDQTELASLDENQTQGAALSRQILDHQVVMAGEGSRQPLPRQEGRESVSILDHTVQFLWKIQVRFVVKELHQEFI